ncbi:MAG: 16S rRNA (cytosine(1402)-N(4))-methyltransferase RsmH [Patescibacteria group bacterium]
MTHQPVLLKEVISYLAPKSFGHYLDGTVGGGGHVQAILEASAPAGVVLGLDRDPKVIKRLRQTLAKDQPRLHLAHRSYADVAELLTELKWSDIDGALLDLGLSSLQLADANRGMSFRLEGPLDLRFDQSRGLPATAHLAKWSAAKLANILETYGELSRGQQLARRLKNFGPITTTYDLKVASGLSHPRRLSQLFQALRIATNCELGHLEDGLAAIWSILRPGGRLVIISFQSLEDRLVKHFFSARAKEGAGSLLTKKVVIATPEEQRTNPRSRSAKLRAIQKI